MAKPFHHLLDLEELDADQIIEILDTAESLKEVSTRSIKKVPALRGKAVVLLFYEPSTRTKISFSMAAERLSADVVDFTVSTSSAQKGESFIDTAKNIEAMGVNIVVVRHSAPGAAKILSECLDAAIINAGDGPHAHPTQALLDIFTIRERFGRLAGLKVAIVGDISHSRVARSNIWGLLKLGIEVYLVGPKSLVPSAFRDLGCRVSYDLDEIVPEVDVINMLRIQRERQGTGNFPSLREYSILFGMNRRRAMRMKENAIIMHPGPINRGVEITGELADCERSVILQQVSNGMAVRMAIMYLLSEVQNREEA